MLDIVIALIHTLASALGSRKDLALENLALRQQLAVAKRHMKRSDLTDSDRIFWIVLARYWKRLWLPKTSSDAGRVEDWRGGPQDLPCLCPGCPPSCPPGMIRSSVSSPLRLARSVRISRTTRSCTLPRQGL